MPPCLAPFFLFFRGMKFLCLFAGLLLLWSSVGFAGEFLVYFGTYTGAKSKGIYVSRFNPATGRLSAPELAAETRNPSFLAVHPGGHFLYAVGEANHAGTVSAFPLSQRLQFQKRPFCPRVPSSRNRREIDRSARRSPALAPVSCSAKPGRNASGPVVHPEIFLLRQPLRRRRGVGDGLAVARAGVIHHRDSPGCASRATVSNFVSIPWTLKKPIYRRTASYGHFGRDGFSWRKNG